MTAPTVEGVAGRAYRIDPIASVLAEYPAHVAMWIVFAPASHPLWPWKFVYCVSLRPIEGWPPAKLRFAGATHEISVISINPEKWPDPTEHLEAIAHGTAHPPHLQPWEASSQVIVRNDADARGIVDALVRAFVDGYLVPDQDFRSVIEQSIATTADCVRRGNHGRHS